MKHIHVNSRSQAWVKVNELFPTDYIKDDNASQNAGYPIYTSTSDTHEYYYISDMNSRIELTLGTTEPITVWITPKKVGTTTIHYSVSGRPCTHTERSLDYSNLADYDSTVINTIANIVDFGGIITGIDRNTWDTFND